MLRYGGAWSIPFASRRSISSTLSSDGSPQKLAYHHTIEVSQETDRQTDRQIDSYKERDLQIADPIKTPP